MSNIPVFELSKGAPTLYTLIHGHGWEPVKAWATLPDGSRQRTDQQERNSAGEGLWSRYAYLNRVVYGKSTPEMIELRSWSVSEPITDEFADDWDESDA